MSSRFLDPNLLAPASHEVNFEKIIPPDLLFLIKKLQKNYPFFSEMEDKEVGQFLKLYQRKTFPEGAKIFREDEHGDDFFLIVSGEVTIQAGGKEIARIRQGSIFGEMALLENEKRTASAFAATPSLLFSVSREFLHSKMPVFANKVILNIARQLSEKLREANGTIRELQKQLETTVT
jgi:CRP-like cAMP-binding protein